MDEVTSLQGCARIGQHRGNRIETGRIGSGCAGGGGIKDITKCTFMQQWLLIIMLCLHHIAFVKLVDFQCDINIYTIFQCPFSLPP